MNANGWKSSLLATLILGACAPSNPWTEVHPGKQEVYEKRFNLAPSEATFQQKRYDENEMSVFFRVLKDGQTVNNLQGSDLQVQENGVNVSPFTVSHETKKSKEVADIVFLVDITGTMVELIETAKLRLAEFIKTSRAQGYHTRMCISTFGDYTVKKCSRFFDNNPDDKTTEAQVKELVSELAQLQAYRGNGKDPGWPDLDENPMGALVDAAKAPWGENSQRFVILVTDWGFLYSPTNQGTIGDKAPSMKQVTEAIKSSQMKVFAVTRTEHDHKGEHLVWDGYNTPFQGEPSIVQSSGGEHFNFDKVLKGEIPLTSILQKILDRLNTTYKLTYVVDQVPGLNPSLTVDKRNVVVKLKDGSVGQVEPGSKLATMPKGRPEYQTVWKASDEKVDTNTMQVFVDGGELRSSDFSVENGTVKLKEVPKPGADIRMKFVYENFEKNLRLEPIAISSGYDPSKLTVYLNGIQAKEGDFVLQKDTENHLSVSVAEGALNTSDPYGVRKNLGLHVKIEATDPGYRRPTTPGTKRKAQGQPKPSAF